MPDPLLLPSIAILSGGGLLAARDYLKRRFESPEDRYMALYGKDQWDASNMDLAVQCDASLDEALKREFLARLEQHMKDHPESVWHEEASLEGDLPEFRFNAELKLNDLLGPRQGVYLDIDTPGRIRVVWNHMQLDGVGMWNGMRDLFDHNPPLLSFKGSSRPPPILPELMALPAVARRLVWRGKLAKEDPGESLYRGTAVWDAAEVRAIKDSLDGSFNLVTAAIAVAGVFERHPDKDKFNVGLTAYFPFMEGRNKYGLVLCRVKRGSLKQLYRALEKQTKNKLVGWGVASAQSYALGRVPERAFAKLVAVYRKKIDILISSLPVGTEPITLGGVPTVISCHPWELTLPYYFLIVGTRSELHTSYTTRYPQEEDFQALSRLEAGQVEVTPA